MDKKIVVFGHSHVDCLAQALQSKPSAQIEVVRLAGLKTLTPWKLLYYRLKYRGNPTICLCIGGNFHNILGLIEHDKPFDVAGADDTGRWPIPRSVLADTMSHDTRAETRLAHQIAGAFPKSNLMVLNVPPPVGDPDHIRKHPGIFRKNIAQGMGPNAMRMRLYSIQTSLFRNVAAALDAAFISPVPAALDPDGFLAPECYNHDPTHSNAHYGAMMLNEIRATAQNPAPSRSAGERK